MTQFPLLYQILLHCYLLGYRSHQIFLLAFWLLDLSIYYLVRTTLELDYFLVLALFILVATTLELKPLDLAVKLIAALVARLAIRQAE